MQKITLIGLGKMGTALATRMLNQGIDLTVYNRTLSKMQPLAELGAKTADTIAQAVADADIVISCLLDDKAMHELMTKADGLLATLPSSAIHMSVATLLPETARILAEQHQMHGSHYVCAAVLGVPKIAYAGQLTCFYAGRADKALACEPLIKTFATNLFNLGEQINAPLILKICMNYALMTSLELISELYVFAEKSGLDPEILQAGLHHIYAHPAFKLYIDKIKARDFDHVNFDMTGGIKDVSIFQKALSDLGIPPRLADLVKSRQISAIAQGFENKDWSSIYEVVRKEAGLDG